MAETNIRGHLRLKGDEWKRGLDKSKRDTDQWKQSVSRSVKFVAAVFIGSELQGAIRTAGQNLIRFAGQYNERMEAAANRAKRAFGAAGQAILAALSKDFADGLDRVSSFVEDNAKVIGQWSAQGTRDIKLLVEAGRFYADVWGEVLIGIGRKFEAVGKVAHLVFDIATAGILSEVEEMLGAVADAGVVSEEKIKNLALAYAKSAVSIEKEYQESLERIKNLTFRTLTNEDLRKVREDAAKVKKAVVEGFGVQGRDLGAPVTVPVQTAVNIDDLNRQWKQWGENAQVVAARVESVMSTAFRAILSQSLSTADKFKAIWLAVISEIGAEIERRILSRLAIKVADFLLDGVPSAASKGPGSPRDSFGTDVGGGRVVLAPPAPPAPTAPVTIVLPRESLIFADDESQLRRWGARLAQANRRGDDRTYRPLRTLTGVA